MKTEENSGNLGFMFHPQPQNASFFDKSATISTNFSTFSQQKPESFHKISFEDELSQQIPAKSSEIRENSRFCAETQEILRNFEAKVQKVQPKQENPEESQENQRFFGFSKSTAAILKQIKAKTSINVETPEKMLGNREISVAFLPKTLKSLINRFETLENAIFFHEFRKNPTFFANLSESTYFFRDFARIIAFFLTIASFLCEISGKSSTFSTKTTRFPGKTTKNSAMSWTFT